MIAAWMLYCCLCALGLSLAALLVERTLVSGRGPLRLIWIGAVAMSLLLPAAAYRFARRPAALDVPRSVVQERVNIQMPVDPGLTLPATAQTPSAAARPSWRVRLERFDGPLAIVWGTLSLAVATNFFGGILLLSWMRRHWQRRDVHGIPVFVSDHTGPAVVGVLSPAIVLPEWVLALEPRQLTLLLRHEQEHQRAGDGRLLTVAQIALILMPWNLALWWQILRLRAAVELDCDARVLQDSDARSYGDLLLEVARPRRAPVFMGATAFAEHATQLERRIRVLDRHRTRTSRAARISAFCIGLVAVSVAWAAPRPPVPVRVQTIQPPVTTPPVNDVPAPEPRVVVPEQRARALATVTKAAAPISTRSSAEQPTAPPRPEPAAEVTQVTPPDVQGITPLVDTVFQRLFEGISLTPLQRVRAREILNRLQEEQSETERMATEYLQANRIRQQELQATRNTALRNLLTNDADRARFDAQSQAGGGPRMGGPGSGGRGGRGGGGGGNDTTRQLSTNRIQFDTLQGGQRMGGGGRGGRGGDGGAAGQRVGRGGGDADPAALAAQVNNLMTEMTYRRMFEGITMSSDQEARARALITQTQQDMAATRPLFRSTLGFNPGSGMVILSSEGQASLELLLSNEADLAKFRSRIVQPRR